MKTQKQQILQKKSKLSFNKFQIAKIQNPQMIIGGDKDNEGGATGIETQR